MPVLPNYPRVIGFDHAAAVSDPRIDLLASGRSDAAQVYDAAAAERAPPTIDDDIARRLRHRGDDVADALPEDPGARPG